MTIPRTIITVIVAVVALVGLTAFGVSGSSAGQVEDPTKWSPNPAKEVTPDNETEVNETESTPICPDENTTTFGNDSADSVIITEVQTEAPGGETENLNGEYVVITNTGETSVDLTGYVLDYDDGQQITISDFDLGAGESVTIHTGTGEDSETDLYAGYGSAVLNNDEPDTVTLFDTSGNVINQVSEYGVIERGDADKCVEVNETNTSWSDNMTTNSTAEVVFNDQESNGTGVVVESITVPDGGFVVIHDMMNLSQGEVEESVIGATYLEPGTTMTVPVGVLNSSNENVLDKEFNRSQLMQDQTLVAVVYRDTDGDGEYDFLSSDGSEDRPYVNESGSAVGDIADIGPAVRDDAFVEINNSASFDGSENDSNSTSVFESASSSPSKGETVNGNEIAEQSRRDDALGIGSVLAVAFGAALIMIRRR